ncbi:hypothetical protein WDW37_11755 [Bdellovibrionota bacterium FG-1]
MLHRRKVVYQTIFPLVLFFCGLSQPALSAGFIRFDSSSFLRHSDERGDMSSTLVLGPEVYTEGRWVAAEMDLKGIAFIQDRNSFTVEAGNLYFATSPKLVQHHQITVGRRSYDFSTMENEWGLGLWNARFLWNPLKPERIGLTGLFYSYQTPRWRVLAFGTPLSPPERSYPIREIRGRLDSSSPDWIPPYDSLVMMNRQVPINYTIVYPPMSELLIRPGGAIQIRYGAEDGPWVAGTYGVMPMHQAQLAVDAGYVPQKGVVDAIVHPRTLFHHLATGEAGYRGKLWSVWASATGESPIQKATPASWQADPMGPALLTSGGGEIRLDHIFSLSASYLGVDESKPAPSPDAVPLNMPSRFEFQKATLIEGRWTGLPYFTLNVRWIYDLGQTSSLLSLDLLYQPFSKDNSALKAMFGGPGSLTFGVGSDLISSADGTGFIGQYVGNDRVRGRISYAF